jgi:hypothetical protein
MTNHFLCETMESVLRMNRLFVLSSLWFLAVSVQGGVRVFVQDSNELAWIRYECTAGEVVRAFALDVTVDRGHIIGISDFFRGPSRADAQGYGIFPASLRDHITIISGTNVDWDVSGYTPLAVVADSPGDTLPGLNSDGVTLEFGGLWDPSVPEAVPRPRGTLCALRLTGPAQVSLALNLSRGGVVPAFPDVVSPVLTGTTLGEHIVVQTIHSVTLADGVLTITFTDGELETAPTINGEWTGTGNTSGISREPVNAAPMRFYRVRR